MNTHPEWDTERVALPYIHNHNQELATEYIAHLLDELVVVIRLLLSLGLRCRLCRRCKLLDDRQ